jgi:glycosyltransferase involved in cell wall biosynthesis
LLSSTYDQVQAVSESVRQYSIESDGIEAERVITCHNGVPDLSQFIDPQQVERLKREASIEPGRAIVTCVANFRHVKGIDVFVRAAAIVASQRPQVQFLVAGEFGKNPADAAFTSSVLALANQLGLASRLKFLGAVQSIPSLLSFSDVFALPSRNEGLSNALLEAMQAGLPSVVTAVGGNTEAVSDGVSGFVVPPEDPDAFALRLLDLLDNPHLRSAMGAASADLAAREFSLDAVLQKVVQSYESLSKKSVAAKLERPKAALVASIAFGLQELPIQEWISGFGLGC